MTIHRATGTKERIMDRSRYEARPKAHRRTRVVGKSGETQTYKKKGDIILTASGKHVVKQEGFQS